MAPIIPMLVIGESNFYLLKKNIDKYSDVYEILYAFTYNLVWKILKDMNMQ